MHCEEDNMGNMDAKQAEEYFNAIVAELGLTDFGFGITTAGSICMNNKILIDERDLQYPWHTKHMILHEIAHHLTPEDNSHGTGFHWKYAELVNKFLAGYVAVGQEFSCFHVTTKDRLKSILKNGLVPNSKPNWFTSETPYVMLSLYPYWWLYDNPILIEVQDPAIKREYFDDPEGLRWPHTIEPKNFKAVIGYRVIKERTDA